MKLIKKTWGGEQLLHNADFCSKIMSINQGAECSVHFHASKKEMFVLIEGAIRLELWNQFPVSMAFAKDGVLLDAAACGIDLTKPDRILVLTNKSEFVIRGDNIPSNPVTYSHIYIDNYVPHRFIGLERYNRFIEVSTYDDVADSYRFTQSRSPNNRQ